MSDFDIKVIDQFVAEEGNSEERETWSKIMRHIKNKPKHCGNCKNSYKNPKGFDFCKFECEVKTRCLTTNYSEWEEREW